MATEWSPRPLQEQNPDDGAIQDLCIVTIAVLLIAAMIYFHYAWGTAGYNSSSAWTTINTPFSRNLRSSQPQGLDAATINSLPITIYHQPSTASSSSDTNETSECSICLGVFEEGEKVKVLQSCCHCYHCECVDKWLITHSTCPMCRISVRVDSSV